MVESKKENLSPIILEINVSYKNFTDFYSENKYNIYKGLVNIFQRIIDDGIEQMEFVIKTNINELPFISRTAYTLESKDLLNVVFLPYFEEMEDYETCNQIKQLLLVLKIN